MCDRFMMCVYGFMCVFKDNCEYNICCVCVLLYVLCASWTLCPNLIHLAHVRECSVSKHVTLVDEKEFGMASVA